LPRHRHIPARFLDHQGAAITEEGRPMRSLWRILAQQWLGGDGSEALTGDSGILEGLLHGDPRPTRAFDVRREPQVSRQAMVSLGMVARPERSLDPEISTEEALRSGLVGRYPR
jgi:hypothetical protein